MKRRAFKFYEEWAHSLLELPSEARHELLDAILTYYLTGKEPPFSNPLLQGFFKMFSKVMDEDAILYEKKCKSSEQAIRKRWSKEKESSERIQPNTNEYERIQPNMNEYQLINKSINELNNELTKEDDVNIILLQRPTIVEAIQRKYKLTKEEIRDWGDQFNDHCRIALTTHKDEKDHLAHFRDWLKIQINESKKHDTSNNNNTSRQQRAEGAAGLVAELLAECDEVRNERELPADF